MRLKGLTDPVTASVDTLRAVVVEVASFQAALRAKAAANAKTLANPTPESRGAADYERNQERHEQNQLRYLLLHFFFSFSGLASYLQFFAGAPDESFPQPVVMAPTALWTEVAFSCRSPK